MTKDEALNRMYEWHRVYFSTDAATVEKFDQDQEALSIIYTALALHNGQTLTTYGEGTENVGQPAPPAEPESDAVSRAKDDILCEEEGKK